MLDPTVNKTKETVHDFVNNWCKSKRAGPLDLLQVFFKAKFFKKCKKNIKTFGQKLIFKLI